MQELLGEFLDPGSASIVLGMLQPPKPLPFLSELLRATKYIEWVLCLRPKELTELTIYWKLRGNDFRIRGKKGGRNGPRDRHLPRLRYQWFIEHTTH